MRVMRPALACVVALVSSQCVRADLRDALIARQVLADVAATCIVRVEFVVGQPVRPPVYATAFSLENVFWLYAPEVGTRVLGPATAIWPDPAVLSARLHALDPSVSRIRVYAHPVATPFRQDQLCLTNACVIGSLHSLTAILNAEGAVSEAGLILMSFDTADASTAAALQVNHSLLAYRLRGQWWCIDPKRRQHPFRLKDVAIGAPLDPALVTLALQQAYPVKSVCLLPLSPATLNRIATNVQWRAPGLED
jgi:hypothetical protein